MGRSIFDDVADADVVTRADRIKPGKYVFDVKNLWFGEKRKGPMFIAELIVAEGKSKETDSSGNLMPCTVAGTTVGQVACFYGNGKDSAPGNMKKAICAVLGEDPKAIAKSDFKATLEELFSPAGIEAQLCRGRRVIGETNASDKGGEVKHFLNLEPAPESVNTPELVAKRRAAIEASGADLAQTEEE